MQNELLKKEKLQLIKVEKIEFQDRVDPTKLVVQYKHLFIAPNGELKIGYRGDNNFEGLVNPSGDYEEKNAKLWFWSGREWNGKMRFTLSGKDPLPVGKGN